CAPTTRASRSSSTWSGSSRTPWATTACCCICRLPIVKRVAAIDCGTNSVRLLIADVGSDLRDLTRQMRIVRLGEGVDRTGRLAPAAIERTRVALVDYAAEIAAAGVDAARMVATSATRDAANADEFRAMVTATLGFAPEVVSGDEEARLTFA